MEIRQVMPDTADIKSARLFFRQVIDFYDLKDVDALDMFARTGDLTVKSYIDAVASVDCWEFNEEHEDVLHELVGKAHTSIGCSYKFLEECRKKYGFVVIDTPQGCHRDHWGNKHYEHFTIVKKVCSILEDDAIVVVYVNKRPYDKDKVGSHGYDQYSEYNYKDWMCERKLFYDSLNSNINEAVALKAYTEAFFNQGFGVEAITMAPCYSDVPEMDPYAFRVAFELKIFKDKAILV